MPASYTSQLLTLAMNETPIKAGRGKRRDKMKTAWYRPLYGEDDEVVFTFSPSHARATFAGTLLSDGAPVYEQFTRQRPALVHAQCWSHTRRKLWLLCWPEAGAETVAIIQSLVSTCRLHGINPYTYLKRNLGSDLALPHSSPLSRPSDVAVRDLTLWNSHDACLFSA